MKSHSCLDDSDYKQGVYDALNETLDEIKFLDLYTKELSS